MLEVFDSESSDRAFEEEVILSGFGAAPVKSEGEGVSFDTAQEGYTSIYTRNYRNGFFAITEEAIEDNLYDRLAGRYKTLARSMANTKQVKAANVLKQCF